MSATSGQRFDYQIYPDGQRGGLDLYPYCGIINGLIISSVTVTGTGNVNLTMNVSAGAAKLDGQYCSLAAAITGLVLPVGTDLNVGTHNLSVWLNPRRVVPALLSAPASPTNGDQYIRVFDRGSFLEVDNIFSFTGGVWTKVDAISSPPEYGHNNLPFNQINPTIHNATTNNQSFSINSERPVYHKTNYPPGVTSQGAAYLRLPASVRIATITITSGTVTVTPYGDDVRISI